MGKCKKLQNYDFNQEKWKIKKTKKGQAKGVTENHLIEFAKLFKKN